MIRGRIDVLIPTDQGITIVDYKTDSISSENVRFRASDYAGQMQQYGQASKRYPGVPWGRYTWHFSRARDLEIGLAARRRQPKTARGAILTSAPTSQSATLSMLGFGSGIPRAALERA